MPHKTVKKTVEAAKKAARKTMTDQIRDKAFLLSLDRVKLGRHGDETSDWLEAENQVKATLRV